MNRVYEHGDEMFSLEILGDDKTPLRLVEEKAGAGSAWTFHVGDTRAFFSLEDLKAILALFDHHWTGLLRSHDTTVSVMVPNNHPWAIIGKDGMRVQALTADLKRLNKLFLLALAVHEGKDL